MIFIGQRIGVEKIRIYSMTNRTSGDKPSGSMINGTSSDKPSGSTIKRVPIYIKNYTANGTLIFQCAKCKYLSAVPFKVCPHCREMN